MAYRNGTYVAFHANGTSNPADSDMKYYNLIKGWDANSNIIFNIVNSHDKTGSVKDSSKKETLKESLKKRLNNSKNMILIIGKTTYLDNDWIPFEIEYAVDTCKIPIIVCDTMCDLPILGNTDLISKIPKSLQDRINNETARCIYVPFLKDPILDAIETFNHNELPPYVESVYIKKMYQKWGLISLTDEEV